jgi:hypothetical protein
MISKDVRREFCRFWLFAIVEERHSARAKMGNSLPKKGNSLHRGRQEGLSDVDYANAIAGALRQDLGTTHQAVKSVMRWTGASERTVKYWLAGTGGPSGDHLIKLARHSDMVLRVFLQRAGRQRFEGALRLIEARDALAEILDAIQAIVDVAEP